MELELGLKITRTREDVSSSVDFHFSKDPFGPLVLSRETDSKFIIIIHLKGFKKEGIEIEINKEGNRITIRGRKPVEEMVLIRWMAWRKEVELRTFKKVFLIPDIVDLDKIKARFDDDDATLTITMPKNVKGISGFKLAEDEEEEEESVDLGYVSETQNREEEFGEMMEDKERESQIFEGEEEGFNGGLDEEETQIEDDDLEKIQEIDEQDKILEFAEEETVSQEELADMNAENEDCSLRKIPEIPEQEDNQEVIEKQVETKSEGIESRAVEEIKEPDELDRTSKSKALENKTSDGDDDDDDGLRKAQGIEEPERHNEESKVQEMVEEETGGQEEVAETKTKSEEFESERETVGQQEFAGTNTEIEDSILRKLPDILEQENTQEVMEQKVSQVETKSDDNNEQEPDERLDRTSDGVETEKKTTDDDGDGLRKFQEIEEPEGHIEGRKIQDIVEGKGEEEKLKREIKIGDPKEDLDAKMGEGFTPNIERTQVVGEDDKVEEFESGKPEADEVYKKHELVGKKEEEEENANVRRISEDRSLIKLQEDKEQHSKRQKRQEKQENIKDLVEEKTPEAETNTENDVLKPVQEIELPEVGTSGETGDEGKQEKEKKKIVARMGVPNIAETETKPAEFESEKLVADEADKIHELVEKKKEEEEEEKNAKVGTQSEDISLRKPQEIQEQQSQGQKRHDKHEMIKELMEEKTPEGETNIGNDTPKQIQGKQKIKEIFQEETKKQPEEHKEKMVETGKKINDAGSRNSQEIIRQQGLDEPERWEKESKPQESVESKTNDEEKEIADTETKEQESYRPKILEEEEKVQELAEEKTLFSKNRKLKEEEKIPEKKTELGDDDVSRKVGDNQQRDSDAETETIAEKFEPHKLEPDEVTKIHELVEKKEEEDDNSKVRRQSEYRSFIKLQENEKQHSKGQKRQEKTAKTETNILKPVQETQVPEVDEFGKTGNEGEDGKDKKKSVPMETKNGYLKEEADAKNGEEFAENTAETETKPEDFESDKMHELVEKKEEKNDNAKVRRQSEDSSLVKNLQETEEQQFQGQKQHNKQEKVKESLEDKTPAAETNIPNPVQVIEEPEVESLETCGKKEIAETEAKEQDSYRPKTLVEQEKIQELAEEEVAEKKTELGDDDHHISRKIGDVDQRDSDAKEEIYAEMGEGFTPNIAETAKKPGEVDNIHELVDKKKDEEEENDKVSKTSEDTSLKRLQEQKFQGPYQDYKQENIKDFVEEKPEADTNIADEDPKPVQETEKPEVETLETCDDKESAEIETKDQESYRPKILGGEDKMQELGEEKTNFSRKVKEEEKVAEKKTEFGDDDISRKVRDIEQPCSDAMKGQEEKDKIHELVLEEKASDGGKRTVAEATAENDKSRKVQETDEQQTHEEDKRGNQFQKVRGEISSHEDVEYEKQKTESDKRLKDSAREAQAIERTDSDVSGKYGKGDMIQELQRNRTTNQNEQKEEADGPEKVTGTRKPVEDKTKEEESETKTDDVLRKVQGNKEHELFEPKRDHVGKIKEVVKEKVAESEIEDECGGLSKAHGSEEQKLHKPNIHKESSKTKINGTKEPSGQEKEEEKKQTIVESMTITENNSTNVQEIKEERPDKPGRHEEDSSKNVREIEKQESDRPKRSTVQDKKQETEDKEITRGMKEKEIVERMAETEDGSLRKVQDDANLELSKPYKRQEEDKVQKPVETGTSIYREKVKKQDVNVPKLVDEEKRENIAKPEGRLEEDDSSKFHEFEEEKSYEDWTHNEREKIKDLVKEEATDPKDKHTGEEGHNDHREEQQEEKFSAKERLKAEEDSSEKVQEIERQEFDELQRSLVQDKTQETKEKDITRSMEENEIVERRTKTKDGILRKVLEDEEDPELSRHKTYEEEDMIPELVEADTSDHREKVKKQDGDDILRSQETGKLNLGELERHCKQRKIHQPGKDEKGEGRLENISEPGVTMEGDSSDKFHEFQKQKSYEDWKQEESEEIEELVKEEVADPKDKHTGGKGEHEKERYEKIPQAKTKVEDEVNKVVDDSTTKIKKTKKEESHESKIHEKLDIVQDFVEDETGDQEDERAGEPAAVVANNEKDSSRKLHSIVGEELKEPEEHKEQDHIPKTSDPKVKEEEGERFSEKEAQVQELEGKTENFKHEDGEIRRREEIKQGKTVETKSDDGIVRKIDEPERRETINHEVELVTEDDSLRKGQEFLENESSNVSKRRPVDQEEIQQLKEVDKREDEEKSVVETKANATKSRKLEMQEVDEAEKNEELKKIRKTMEDKTNAPEKEEGNEKIAEVKMQDKIDIRMKDQDTKRPEPYELLENEEHDKIPEPIFEGTKYQREEEKRMADRETEEMKRKYEDVSSRQKIKAEESDGLEKHRKLSKIHENDSVTEKIPDEEEEVNERGGYKAVLKKRSMEDSSQSQDVEEKGSDQTEQESIQGLMVEEEGKEEYDIREREQNQKAKRIPQVELKANDDNSRKNVTERLSGEKQNEDHQELVEMEKNDQGKEVREEKIVGNGDTIDHEYKIQEHEEENSDKLERHREEQRSGSLAEEKTSNDKEENRGNRAGAERKIRDDGFEEEEVAVVLRHKEQDKRKSFVENDTTGKAKENKNHETKSRDDSSRKTQDNEKQKSHEQKRNNEEQDKKNLGPNYCRNEEDGKEDKEIAEAEGPRELKWIEYQDNINELVEEKMNKQEGEDKKSMSKEVLAKSEDHESEEPERLRKQDKSKEVLQQRLRDNLEDEETEKTETKTNDKESRKVHQIKSKETGEEERRIEQGRTKESVEDRTQKQNRETEFEDGSSKNTPEIDKEGLTEPKRDEKRDEMEEQVDRETSEDEEEEELEVEVEDSEEDWEAEVIQDMDADEDNDKIRQIRRIKLGFPLVGGSTLFMSLIVIVISIIRSKRKIRCYKF